MKVTEIVSANRLPCAVKPRDNFCASALHLGDQPVELQIPCECGQSLFATEGMAGQLMRSLW
jgi:hypothetical protein